MQKQKIKQGNKTPGEIEIGGEEKRRGKGGKKKKKKYKGKGGEGVKGGGEEVNGYIMATKDFLGLVTIVTLICWTCPSLEVVTKYNTLYKLSKTSNHTGYKVRAATAHNKYTMISFTHGQFV